MKKLFILLIALFVSGLTYGQYFNESFDGSTFPPVGWNQTQLTLTGLWDRVTVGVNPACATHSGSGMIRYNAWDFAAGTSAVLISPAIDLSGITASTILEFWMYRDNAAGQTTIDSLSFYINTSANLTGATLLGNFNRAKFKAPIETGPDGWYKYQISIPLSFNSVTNYLLLKGYSGYGSSMFIDDIRILNPVAGNAAPTNMVFANTTVSSTTIGWTDNSTNEYSFSIYKSTSPTTGFVLVDSYIASNSTAAVGSTYTKTITGLSENTQYYFRISANAGLESGYLTGSVTSASGILSGVKTIGPTGVYASLTAAFADINLNGLASAIDLVLQPNYISTVETFPIVPSVSASVSKPIRIYPSASGLSITSSNPNGTINFDGSSYIIIDGRVNATGASKDLVIANTSKTAYTIRFINDAKYNTIKFCSNQGVDSTGIGVINFSTTTGINGNSYNLIDSCDIRDGATSPVNAIYSSGTAGSDNKNNTISNCNIFNFYKSTSTSSTAVGLFTGNTSWNILNNSFYQTSILNPTAAYGFNIIYIGAGDNYNISGNYIGGSSPMCGGTPFTLNGLALTNYIYVIRIAASSGINPNSIQGNTIANISLQSYSTTVGSIKFAGILSSAGTQNIGTISGNIIGSSTTNGSILYTSGNSASTFTSAVEGIYISAGTANIQNNTIGGITLNATTASTQTLTFYGIYAQGSGINIISNNTIGSNTLANSIQTVAATSTPVIIAGIYTNITTASSTITYSGNTIANITNNNTPAGGYLLGLRNAGTVTSVVENNIIHDLTSATLNIGTTNLAAIVGISSSNSANNIIISKNKLYNFTTTAATAAVAINGIYRSGTNALNGRIERNLIYNFSTNSSATTASITGIYSLSGSSNYSNNMIRLGYKSDGSVLTNGIKINGLFDSGLSNNYYFNTVYIGGNNVISSDSTYALRSLSTSARNFVNNIFINARSNASGNGKNYAVSIAGTTPNPSGLSMDYNIYQATGTGGIFGRFNAQDVNDLMTWKTNVGLDTNSLSVDPLLVAPMLTIPDLHLALGSPAEGAGTYLSAVSDDFDGDIRVNNSPTDIGADAGYFDNILPTATFVPANSSTAISLNAVVQVSFNEMVRKIDNTVLDSSNVASVISFKKVSDNSNVPFTASWNATSKTILVTPNASLLGLTTYNVKVLVEDYNNNLINGTDSTRFTTVVSSDASLSDLKVNGVTVNGFSSTVLSYNVTLPSGTTVVPSVTAFTNDINATKVITPAVSLPGTTSVLVTAQNGTTTQTYTVNFLVAPNTDASLSDLKVNGITVAGFSPVILNYNIALPYGTVTVPTVTATTTDANATKVITNASVLPGTTTVVVTAGDATTTKTYTLHFTIVPPATDASLSDLKVNGTTVAGFSSSTYVYNVVLPNGTTVVPTVTATTTDNNAVKVITPAASLPGSTNVLVTAQDGLTTKTYTVNFTVAPSAVATLSDIKVNGTTIPGFNSNTISYNYALAYGTTVIPTVTATTTNVNATKVITPTTVLPGTTTIVVTAQDGLTTKTYTVNFTITAPSTNASLSDIKVNGTTVTGFNANTLNYNVVLPAGTTTVPTVTATTANVNATKVITPATALPGTTTIVVTAQDGVTSKTYTVNFTVSVQTYSVTFNVLNGNGSLTATVDASSITSPATVVSGKNVIFTAVPNTGYEVKEWTLNGNIIPGNTTNSDTLFNLSANATVTVEFKLTIGINDLDVNSLSLSINPNPTTGIFSIKLNRINTNLDMQIIDIHGKSIYFEKITSENQNNTHDIDLSAYPKGMYFVKLSNNNFTKVEKIILQ